MVHTGPPSPDALAPLINVQRGAEGDELTPNVTNNVGLFANNVYNSIFQTPTPYKRHRPVGPLVPLVAFVTVFSPSATTYHILDVT